MNSFFRVKTIQEAQKMLSDIQSAKLSLKSETVSLLEATGRVLAEDFLSPIDVPGFERSTVDGYAVIAADTFTASEENPVYLPVVGEVLMGQEALQPLQSGEIMGIATGAMLPANADAVVMVEYTETVEGKQIGDAKGRTYIEITKAVVPGENRLRRAEDVAAGQYVLSRGTRLSAASIGLLAALGVTQVPVYVRPVVGLISTGDELVAPDTEVIGAKVRDINSYALGALAKEAGADVRLYGVIPDHFDLLRQTLEQAVQECDIICLSGGSSVGTRDLTERVLGSLKGADILFHGLHIKPGKPTLAVNINGVLIFGLPGHPASALTVFRLIVCPLLDVDGRFLRVEPFQCLLARIDRNIASNAGREEYLPVRLELLDQQWWAVPVFGKSGLIHPLAQAQGLARIPLVKEGVKTGDWLEVLRL